MAAITADISLFRVGVEGLHQPVSAPMGANVTVYAGTIALATSGGYLKSPDSPASTDIVQGMVLGPSAGTAVNTGSGIANGATSGNVFIDCATGTFLLKSGTGSDQLSEATANATVYMIDGQTAGATNGGSTRPTLGVQLPLTTDIPSGYYPIKLNGVAGTGP